MTNLLDGDARGDHLSRLGAVFKAIATVSQFIRYSCATHRGDALHLRKTCKWQDTGHDHLLDTFPGAVISEAQEHVGIKKELSNRAARSGV